MEKVENPTALRVKNSFSIENILSRPETKSQRLHETFSINEGPNYDNESVLMRNNGERIQNFTDNDDPESNSEAASDDGNSSVHSK